MTPQQFKQLRQELGLTQRQMTEALGLRNRRQVQRYETGEQEIQGAVLRVVEYIQRYGVLTN